MAKINLEFEDDSVQMADGSWRVLTEKNGKQEMRPVDTLELRMGITDNSNERVQWVEYWDEGVLVHRSAHLTLKKASVFTEGVAAAIG